MRKRVAAEMRRKKTLNKLLMSSCRQNLPLSMRGEKKNPKNASVEKAALKMTGKSNWENNWRLKLEKKGYENNTGKFVKKKRKKNPDEVQENYINSQAWSSLLSYNDTKVITVAIKQK